jgi:hypothetical protein
MRCEVRRHDPHLVHLPERHVRAQLAGATSARERGERASLELVRLFRQRTPIDEPASREPERVERTAPWVRREHETRPRVGGLEHAPQSSDDRAEPPPASAQPQRALVALRGGRLPHPRLDLVEQAASGVAVDEQP